MALDIELYRRTLFVPVGQGTQNLQRISVIDIHPEEASQTILFVHGFGGDVSQWVHQLRFFAPGMHLIAPNLRGHGLSDDPTIHTHTMESFVRDLEVVLEELHVQEPVHLIAHSFGGAIATEFVLRHPERIRSLVLIGVTTHFTMIPLLGRLLHVPDPLFGFAAKRLGIALFASQRTLKGINEGIMSSWHMPSFSVPTLVVLGYRDRVFRRSLYEDVLRCNPAAQLIDIPVSAHLVQLERPDAVNRAIVRFLEKQSPDTTIQTASIKKPSGLFQWIARKASFAAQHSDMPWLNHYEQGVPAVLPTPRQLLHDLLGNSAAAFPRRPAISFFGRQMRYRELDRLSTRFAHGLRGLGLQAGERVAIVLPNIPQCVIAFYGALKAGMVVVFGDPLLQEQGLHHRLSDNDVRALITLESLKEVAERACRGTPVTHIIYTTLEEYLPARQRDVLLPLIRDNPLAEAFQRTFSGKDEEEGRTPARRGERLRVSSLRRVLRGQPITPFDSGRTSDDLALIHHTGGTVGPTRGVMLSHANLVANVAQLRHFMNDATRGREVILPMFPLSHLYGLTAGMNIAVALAGSLLLVPTLDMNVVLAAIKRSRPTLLIGYPGLFLEMANTPNARSYNVSAIRACLSSSAPLLVEVQEAFEKVTRGHLVEAYGLTEASPLTHVTPLKGERRVGSIGLPLPSTQVRVIDVETGEPLPAGGVGELLIRGPQVMRGYWRMPEATHKVLQDGWLHTGDIVQMDEDGFFTFIERKEHLALFGAFHIAAREVEEVFYEHPKVLEVAVVGVPMPEEKEGKRATKKLIDANSPPAPFITAFVVVKRGQRVTADDLLKYARDRLPGEQVPQRIEFRKELPKSADGKVLRGVLLGEA